MITLVLVTRGDVDLDPIKATWPFEIVVWDNSTLPDVSVYGRYAAIEDTDSEFIAVQDDDCIVPWEALLDEYKPGERLCNMNAAKQAEYRDSSLIGWGAIFPRDDPDRAFRRYAADFSDERFQRTADVVFTTLSPFRRVNVGRQDLPYWNDTTRMHLQPEHFSERAEVTRECLALPRLSVVIPTTGRTTLAAAVASARDADEIVIVEDRTRAAQIPTYQHVRVEHVVGKGRQAADVGYTARTHGMNVASCSHIAFMDDDDAYAPGAIDVMRDHLTDHPVLFRMDHPDHGILWRAPIVQFGNVSTQMLVIPNEPDKFGEWSPHAPHLPEPGGDYTFIAGCEEKMGPVEWHPDVICQIRPHERRTVAIVTPWLEHPELMFDYAAALSTENPTEVLVVDNGGAPDDFPPIPAGENLGFARASNLGLRAATSDIVVFLNNDISATRPGWLRDLTARVEPGVLVGHTLRNEIHGQVDGEQLPYLDGWCLAGMREDLLELGGFDEDYDEPAYYSDNELCLRARAAGMTLREVPVGLIHKCGVTTNANGHFLPSTIANRERFERLARELMAVPVG